MPSCSSKFSILRDNDCKILIDNLCNSIKSSDSTASIRFLYSSAPNGCIKYFPFTVTLLKIPWWCLVKDKNLIFNIYFWQSCLVFNSSTPPCINHKFNCKKINCDSNFIFQCKAAIYLSIIYQVYILKVLKLFYKFVIYFKLYYLVFKVSIIVLLNQCIFQISAFIKKSKFVTSWISNGINFNCVMELDESEIKVNSLDKNLINGEKSLPKVKSESLSSDNEKHVDNGLTVINDNQIMKGSVSSPISKNVLLENSINVEIKDIKKENLNDLLPNGNLNSNLHINGNNWKTEKLQDIVQVECNKKVNSVPITETLSLNNNNEVIEKVIVEAKDLSRNESKNHEVCNIIIKLNHYI